MRWNLVAGVPDEDVRRLVSVARRRRFSPWRGRVPPRRPRRSLHLVQKGRFAVRIMRPLGETMTIAVRAATLFSGALGRRTLKQVEPRQLPTGTVTLLFTDIEGSTRLLQELGREAYVRALTEHRRLLREAFTTYGGIEVEMQGDSFHFAFPFARDAVAAAVAGQHALAAHAWESEPIRVRIGIHTGEPVQTEGLYAGLDVHKAARIMSAAHGGQILVSARTADLVQGELADVDIVDLGMHRLKDVAAAQHLYQVGRSDPPPPKSLGRAPFTEPGRPPRRQTPSRPSSRSRLVGPALAATIAAAIAIPVFALGRGDAEPERVGTAEYGVTARIPVGNLPLAIVAEAGAVWVANGEDGTVSRIDARTSEPAGAAIPVGRAPTSVSIGEGALWVANSNDGSVTRIDTVSRSVVATIQVGTSDQFAYDVVAGEGSVWVVVFTLPEGRDMSVVRIDPRSNRVVGKPISLGTGNGGRLAVGAGFVWATNESANTVTRIDPRRGAAVGPPVSVGQRPQGLVVVDGSLWVLNGEGTVRRFSTSTLQPLGTPIIVGSKPTSIAAGDGAIWVVNAESLTLSRIDPKVHKIVGAPVQFTSRVAGEGAFAAVGAGAVWVANAADDEVVRIASR